MSPKEKDALVEQAMMTCMGRRILRETIRKTGSTQTIITLSMQCAAIAVASGNRNGELDCMQMIIETLDEGTGTMTASMVDAIREYVARHLKKKP